MIPKLLREGDKVIIKSIRVTQDNPFCRRMFRRFKHRGAIEGVIISATGQRSYIVRSRRGAETLGVFRSRHLVLDTTR